MYVSLYNNMSQPITSGNMHAQIDKCAYARNHGHNNMGCGHECIRPTIPDTFIINGKTNSNINEIAEEFNNFL